MTRLQEGCYYHEMPKTHLLIFLREILFRNKHCAVEAQSDNKTVIEILKRGSCVII